MYRLIQDPVAIDEIDHLPQEALAALAELFTMLQTAPWGGRLVAPSNPKANMLTHTFGDGRGMATYFVLEEQREVHLMRIAWP